MTTKDYVKIADAIAEHNRTFDHMVRFLPSHISTLADVFEADNPKFDRNKFFAYLKAKGVFNA